MVGSNIKEEAIKLMDKRSGIEAEIDVIISRLSGVGVSGGLVDAEGFPRTDIDISSVRSDRRRLHELRNDHKDITEKINQHIHMLHSAKVLPTPTSRSGHVETSLAPASPIDADVVTTCPFALVDEINEASPAAEDGLQLGDQLVKFGNVEFAPNLLQKLAAEAQENQGRQLSVVVIRQGVPVNLTITPRPWEGRGLLGCHFQML